MGSSFANHSHSVLINIASRLHVPEELVRAAQFGSWKIFQLIGLCLRWDAQQETHVAELSLIGLLLVEPGPTEDQHVDLSMLLSLYLSLSTAQSWAEVDLWLLVGLASLRQQNDSQVCSAHHCFAFFLLGSLLIQCLYKLVVSLLCGQYLLKRTAGILRPVIR